MDPRVCRTQKVSCREEFNVNTWRNWNGAMEPDGLKLSKCSRRVGRREKRQRWPMTRISLTIGFARVFFLNVCGVRQDERAQILRARGAKHPTAKALRYQPRQEPAVIEMCVREHHGV
jgi:hypothetical protein